MVLQELESLWRNLDQCFLLVYFLNWFKVYVKNELLDSLDRPLISCFFGVLIACVDTKSWTESFIVGVKGMINRYDFLFVERFSLI